MFQTLKLLPGHILGIEGEQLGVLGFALIGLILVGMPFLDSQAQRAGLQAVERPVLGYC